MKRRTWRGIAIQCLNVMVPTSDESRYSVGKCGEIWRLHAICISYCVWPHNPSHQIVEFRRRSQFFESWQQSPPLKRSIHGIYLELFYLKYNGDLPLFGTLLNLVCTRAILVEKGNPVSCARAFKYHMHSICSYRHSLWVWMNIYNIV